VKSIVRLLTEETTADVVPALVAPIGKLVVSEPDDDEDEEDDEDEDDEASESIASRLINNLLEDCPCDLIPDDAQPIDGATLKGLEDEEEKIAPAEEDEVLSTLLGGEAQSKTDDSLKVESSPGASRPSVDCKGCGNSVPKGEALNDYCPECVEKFQAREKSREKKSESRDDVMHRMASFSQKTPTASESLTLKSALSEAAMIAAIGASTPTMLMPSGNDADAEKTLASNSIVEDKTVVIAATTQSGTPMPEPRKGDGAQILSAFRRFGKV
jgi:hypothetical protein